MDNLLPPHWNCGQDARAANQPRHNGRVHTHLGAAEGKPNVAADRFLTLSDVADVLNISASQTYALVRGGELEAIKIGGRGQWRVEREKLEAYISRMYDQTRQFVSEHPFAETEDSR